jgi:FtsP/CotA-like multicopper oxidase with cupredoxin domain
VVGAGIVTVPISGVSAKSASKLSDSNMPRPYGTPLTIPPPLAYQTTVDADGVTTRHYTMTQRLGSAKILSRLTTPILGYNGIFPGPTIRIDRGTRAIVRVRNQLPAKHPTLGYALPTSTHLHGSASLPQYDGYANDPRAPTRNTTINFRPDPLVSRSRGAFRHKRHWGWPGSADRHPVEKGLPQDQLTCLTISDAMASSALG